MVESRKKPSLQSLQEVFVSHSLQLFVESQLSHRSAADVVAAGVRKKLSLQVVHRFVRLHTSQFATPVVVSAQLMQVPSVAPCTADK